MKHAEWTSKEVNKTARTVFYNTDAEQARNMYLGYHQGRPLQGVTASPLWGTGILEGFEYWSGPILSVDPFAPEAVKKQAQNKVADYYSALARSFVAENMIKDSVDRVISALLAHQPKFRVLDPKLATPDVTARSRKAEALLRLWWERQSAWQALSGASTYAVREGRGLIRIAVRPIALEGGTKIRKLDPLRLIRYLVPEVIAPELARVVIDPETGTQAAAYTYERESDSAEISELTYVDPDTLRTVLKLFSGDTVTAVEIPLGERLNYIQIEMEPLISRSVLQNQRLINATKTMMAKNSELAGFLERYAINVKPPMRDEVYTDADGERQTRRVPVALEFGPGKLTALAGQTVKRVDANGNEYEEAMAGVQYGRFEPSPPDALIATLNSARESAYNEVAQAFALMNGQATASGRSREVAIADFMNRVSRMRQAIEKAGRELLESVVAMLGHFTGNPDWSELRVDFFCLLQPVPRDSADRAQDLNDAVAGVISYDTARARQGITDSAAEQGVIDDEYARGYRQRPAAVTETITEKI